MIDLTLYKDGVPVAKLNARLVEKQNLNEREIDQLKRLHFKRSEIFEEMKATDKKEILQKLFKDYTKNEFALQKAWKFNEDENYHRWWEVPKCKCPKLDNEDSYGTSRKIYNGNCPIHGELK